MFSFNVLDFQRQLDREKEKFHDQFNDAVERAVELGYDRIVSNGGHEIDTGRAISSWEIGVNRRRYINLPKLRTAKRNGVRIRAQDYHPSRRNFNFDIRKHRSLFISNNVDYLQYLDGAQAAFSGALMTIRRSMRYRFTRIKI